MKTFLLILCPRETEKAIDVNIYQFQNDIEKMDSAVKSLNSIASEQFTKYKTTHKKDYQVSIT